MPTKNSPFKLSMLMVLAWLAAVPAVNAAQAGNITKLKGDVYIGRPDVPVITAKGDDPINEGKRLVLDQLTKRWAARSNWTAW